MKEIKDMTLQELKALAFDQLRARDVAQNNLNVLNKEISDREKVISEEKVGN